MNIANQKDISVKWNILFIMLFLPAFIAKAQISETVFIEKVQTYQDSVKIRQGRNMFDDVLDPATFNIRDYMKMFNALKLKNPKHEYGCFYFDNFLDGKPYIYTGNHDFDAVEKVMLNVYDKIGKEKTDWGLFMIVGNRIECEEWTNPAGPVTIF